METETAQVGGEATARGSRTWVRGLVAAVVGAGLGASCPFWPEEWQRVCHALADLAQLVAGV